MNKKSFTKRVMALALSLIMVVGLIPTQAFAVSYSTYDVSYRTQSENNESWIRYGLTDSSAGSFSIEDRGATVEFRISLNNGWYFEKWDTWFNGGQDKAWASDPSYDESNPKLDDNYTFFNTYSSEPISSFLPYITVDNLKSLYGDFRIASIVRPILTVNAGDGINYQISTNNPLTTNLSSNQVAVVYGNDATVSYTVDEKYVVTDVNASGTKTINIDKTSNRVVLVGTEKPTSVGIHTRLKQQNVAFDANGGSGTMTQQTYSYGEAQALTANSFTRTGYTFAGWNTKADGSGTSYTDKQSLTFSPVNDGDSITLYAQWDEEPVIPSDYTVSFNANGGDSIAPITVTHGEKYGRLPSSAVTGLSGGDSNWYLVDENGIITDIKITRFSVVSKTGDHTLFVKRKVLAPTVSVALTVPGGLSDNYQYYIPENSQRVLTASVSNMNTDILDYSYQWYKNGQAIDGATSNILTLNGNVSDAATYKVKVTATLKESAEIIVTENSAFAEKEQKVTILHAANTLNYDANGGEGGPSSNYTGGISITVQTSEPTRNGYVFGGWNAKADGTGESYVGGENYTFAEDNGNGGCNVTLYAKWVFDVPAGEIKVENNGWTTFLNTITFGQFFKESQDVTISATALGSDINSIEYYIANAEMTLDEVKAITTWQGYNGTFKINPDNRYVIYAKITNNAGNVTYISSDGLVLDATAPSLIGIENNGVYYGDKVFKAIDDNFPKIEIDSVDVTDTAQGDDEYKIIADNAEHTVTVTDKAGNVIEYKVTVYKNYTVTYKADGETVSTETVGHGKDATLPAVPAKDGYTGKWDHDGKNITSDIIINAVYTESSASAPSDPQPPQTGDNSHTALWLALLFISGSALIALTVYGRKRRYTSNK